MGVCKVPWYMEIHANFRQDIGLTAEVESESRTMVTSATSGDFRYWSIFIFIE